jgi:hypothetical protein
MFIVKNPSLFFRKKAFEDFDLFTSMTLYSGIALLHVNASAWAMRAGQLVRYLSFYNIRRSYPALILLSYGSVVYALAGLSIKTAQRLLGLAKAWGIEEDQAGYIGFNVARSVYLFHRGQWDVNQTPKDVIDKAFRTGNIWDATTAAFYTGMRCVDTGDEKNMQLIFDWLKKIETAVDYNYTYDLRIRLSCIHLAKRKEYAKLIKMLDDSIERVKASDNQGILLNIYFFLTQAYIGLDDHEKAYITFNKVENLIRDHNRFPIFMTNYLITKLKLGLYEISLKEEENTDVSKAVRPLLKTARTLLRKSRKNPSTMCGAYHLNAILLMRMNRNGQALKSLEQAIETGEKYDLRPDLARAFFEMGKFLLDPENKQNKVNNLSGRDYLQKARRMFEEMKLQQDLMEYDEYISSHGA